MIERPAPSDVDRLERLSRDAAQMDLVLDKSQLEALWRHQALIQQWNRVYNLTAIHDPQAMYEQHLLDSLAIVAPLRRHWDQQRGLPATLGPSVLDVGSGAGLPGVPIAIAEPTWTVTCIDTVGKKAAFVKQVGGELGLLGLTSLHGRVETLPSSPGHDIIVSRAFASLQDFTSWTRHLLRPDGIWVAMKGKLPDSEMDNLLEGVEVFHVEPLRIPGQAAERCLVWMRDRLRS